MPPAVAAEEGDAFPLQRPGDIGVGRAAEGRVERDLADIPDSVDFVKPRASEDSDIGLGMRGFVFERHVSSSFIFPSVL